MIWLFDLLLVLLILALAWRSISARDLFESIVVFIAMGLMIALAWVRLQSPDAALAEAAIGSGLAGALLLATLSQMTHKIDYQPRRMSWLWMFAWGILALVLLLSLWLLPTHSASLMPYVLASLDDSGVGHPVTAVLLNYRAWDTALELAVLAWAWYAQRSFADASGLKLRALQGRVIKAAVWSLLPLVALVAAYLLWRGAQAPGGAFQSGAVLAAGLVMLILAQRQHTLSASVWLGLAWGAGFSLFMLIGLIGVALGDSFMTYPKAYAGALILMIEIFAALSIGLLLAAMVIGRSQIKRGEA